MILNLSLITCKLNNNNDVDTYSKNDNDSHINYEYNLQGLVCHNESI